MFTNRSLCLNHHSPPKYRHYSCSTLVGAARLKIGFNKTFSVLFAMSHRGTAVEVNDYYRSLDLCCLVKLVLERGGQGREANTIHNSQ